MAIEGEPGIGKSRLLAELRAHALQRGWTVLSGAGAEFERDEPYGVWIEALDEHVASLPWHDHELLADLSAVVPSLGGGSSRGDERHRLHRAVRRLLAVLAERRPLLVVFDDLHWSDAGSIELLGACVRRGIAPGVLLALGYRTGRASAALRATLGSPTVGVLELTTLSEADCRTLTGEDFSETLFRDSGGNPFYALQLARAPDAPERAIPGVPRSVAGALFEELTALSAPARALIDAGAIAGDPFEPELAYAIAELEPETGTSALDELLATRLLHPTRVPRRFAFRHPLVRRAVYESSGGGWRLAAHARAAQALNARGASAVARAHHVEQAAVAGDEDAIATLLEAATATVAHAPATAAHWFDAALRVMPERDAARRGQTLIAQGRALRSIGENDRCVDCFTEAMTLLGPEPALTAATAFAEDFLGRHDSAKRRLAALAVSDDAAGIAVLLARFAGSFFTLDLPAGKRLSRQALEIAERLGEPLLIGSTAAAVAHGAANAGDVPTTITALARATEIIDAADDEALASQIDALNRLAWSEHLIERDGDAIRHAARGIAIAQHTGQDQFVPILAGAQALSTLRQGALSRALAIQDDALETAEVTANGYVTAWVLATSVHLALVQGDDAAAERAAERAVTLVAGLDGRIPLTARTRLAIVRGEDPAGNDALPPSMVVDDAERLTRRALADGRLADAERYAAWAERVAAGLGLPVAGALARRARAAVLLAKGDAPAAATLALDAIPEAAPIDAARSRSLAGRALAAAGERTAAISQLRSAERAFDARDIIPDRDQARRELRRLGARSEPRGPATAEDSGLGSLTKREREIADLVTDRKTNREIAAELFLSEKTVESHLRNVFAKLGAASRVDVARAVERSGQP